MQTEAEILKTGKKNEVSFSNLRDSIEWSNICVIRAPKGEKERIVKNYVNK